MSCRTAVLFIHTGGKQPLATSRYSPTEAGPGTYRPGKQVCKSHQLCLSKKDKEKKTKHTGHASPRDSWVGEETIRREINWRPYSVDVTVSQDRPDVPGIGQVHHLPI